MQILTEVMKMRATPKLRRRIERAAKRCDMAPSTFIRWCVEGTLNNVDGDKKKYPKEGF